MKGNVKKIFLGLIVVLLFSGQSWASYTADSVQDIWEIGEEVGWETGESYGSTEVNGQSIWWSPGHESYTTEIYVNDELVATYHDSRAGYDEEMRVSRLIAQALGISILGGFSSPTSAAAKATSLVFNKVVMPTAKTRRAKEKAAALKAMNKTRTFGGQLRYASIEQDNSDGDLIGCNLGMAHDFENFTLGGIIPYDYVDLDDIFDADRVGLILYAQYFYDISAILSSTFTANINYLYTDLDYDAGGSDNIDTIGGGLSASLTLDQDAYVASLALSYQYNEDDIDTADDHQHLIKVGANAGYRIGQNIVATLFTVWNQDITDYKSSDHDETYFDIGAEATLSLGDTFALTAGYKKVVDLDNYESDEIYLGSRLDF